MSGVFNGLKFIILEENPSAFFVHCFAHQLQLAVVGVSENNSLVVDFFNYTSLIVTNCASSCKRSDALKQIHHEKIIEMLDNGELCTGRGKNQETVIKHPGDTRWGSYHTTIIRLVSMWSSVIEVLEIIKIDGNAEQRGIARGLVFKMGECEFVFTMHPMKKIMGITNELSHALQRKDQDIVNAMGLVKAVKQRMNTLRMRDEEWDEFLKEIDIFCARHSITVPKMDDFVLTRQCMKSGDLKNTFLHHFGVEVFYCDRFSFC